MSNDSLRSFPGFGVTQNSILRINDVKTIQLIKAYKKEECLWNTSLYDYPNREKRLIAADKIAKLLDIPNFEGRHVMIKFKNLRNSYCQELKKIEKSEENVKEGKSKEVYKPKVQWFPLMDSFIRPHLQSFRPSSLRKPPSMAVESITSEPEVKLEFYESDGQEQEDWTTAYAEHSSAEGQSDNDEHSNDSRAKRSKLSNKQIDNENSLFFASEDGQTDFVSRAADTFDSFGKYVASLMRNLPPDDALKLQPKIVNMIVDVGLKELKTEIKSEPTDFESADSD